ncbi:hypothetical protein SB2_25580 [Methylobacterium radiotolerans]|nr:hypothetical protein SB3_28305 [Methylobacterium radiotolerans]KTS44107.1 hypothetical protein SB2_25580 [Methylobacterium radiotolerans]
MAEATTPITTASNPRVGPLERVRHLKRGTEYEVLGEAELQIASVDMLNRPLRLSEGARLTVYRGSDGKLWARETDEFRDGRFKTIDAALTPKSSPSQTPVDPQMTVEEARRLLDGVRDPVRLAQAYRDRANSIYMAPEARRECLDHCLNIEAALRTLQAAGEVR